MYAPDYPALREFIGIVYRAEGVGVAASIRAAIQTELSPRQRQLVEMYYIRRLRMQDIADELGIDISTVSRTLKRARVKLRRCLRYGSSALLNSLDD